MTKENEEALKKFAEYWNKPLDDIVRTVVARNLPLCEQRTAETQLEQRFAAELLKDKVGTEARYRDLVTKLTIPKKTDTDEKYSGGDEIRSHVALGILAYVMIGSATESWKICVTHFIEAAKRGNVTALYYLGEIYNKSLGEHRMNIHFSVSRVTNLIIPIFNESKKEEHEKIILTNLTEEKSIQRILDAIDIPQTTTNENYEEEYDTDIFGIYMGNAYTVQAIKEGHDRALYNLASRAYAYSFSMGKSGIDIANFESHPFYQQAAKEGNAQAFKKLAEMLGINEDEKNNEATIDYYRRAVINGDCEAAHRLGEIHEPKKTRGLNVEWRDAISFYQSAAAAGYSHSSQRLGDFYYQRNDYKQTHAFYLQALDQFTQQGHFGNSNLFYRLGEIYQNGFGIEQNFKQAIAFFTRAYSKKNASRHEKNHLESTRSALISTGEMYEHGLGVIWNLATAAKFYRHANKLELPKDVLDHLARVFTKQPNNLMVVYHAALAHRERHSVLDQSLETAFKILAATDLDKIAELIYKNKDGELIKQLFNDDINTKISERINVLKLKSAAIRANFLFAASSLCQLGYIYAGRNPNIKSIPMDLDLAAYYYHQVAARLGDCRINSDGNDFYDDGDVVNCVLLENDIIALFNVSSPPAVIYHVTLALSLYYLPNSNIFSFYSKLVEFTALYPTLLKRFAASQPELIKKFKLESKLEEKSLRQAELLNFAASHLPLLKSFILHQPDIVQTFERSRPELLLAFRELAVQCPDEFVQLVQRDSTNSWERITVLLADPNLVLKILRHLGSYSEVIQATTDMPKDMLGIIFSYFSAIDFPAELIKAVVMLKISEENRKKHEEKSEIITPRQMQENKIEGGSEKSSFKSKGVNKSEVDTKEDSDEKEIKLPASTRHRFWSSIERTTPSTMGSATSIEENTASFSSADSKYIRREEKNVNVTAVKDLEDVNKETDKDEKVLSKTLRH